MQSKLISLLLCLFLLVGCGGQQQISQEEGTTETNTYAQISAEEAKTMMEEQEEFILLDVRSQEEFDTGHIAGAIVLPDNEIVDRAEEELTDKDATIFIYCRSGRRSKLAAQALADLGYTDVYEFGGIINWPYDTVTY